MAKITLYIDEEYLKLMPRPTIEEEKALKQSLKEEGLLVPITINKKGMVIDGHTRFKLCQELKIPLQYMIKDFESEHEQKEYGISVNIRRRNLNPMQTMMLIDNLREHWLKTIRKNRDNKSAKIKKGEMPLTVDIRTTENSILHKTIEYTGLKQTTIADITYIRRHGTNEEIEACLKGDVTPSVMRKTIGAKNADKGKSIRKIKQKINPDTNNRRYNRCPKCGYIVRKRKCHVHKLVCCTQCSWGTDNPDDIIRDKKKNER